jgi:hypothetical protein
MDWFRSWHGAPTDPKWLLIAKRSETQAGIVSSIVWALFDFASQNSEDRGSIEGFDIETYAAFSGFDESTIGRVIECLKEKKVIVGGRLAAWERRQTKRDDNSTPRVQKCRNAMKHGVTHETLREEKIREDKKDTEANASGAEAPIDPSTPEREYFIRGREVLGKNAGGLIGKLLKAKGGNVALARAAIEQASQKQNPTEYIAACCRDGPLAKPLTEFQRKQQETNDVRAELRNFGKSSAGGGALDWLLSDDHGQRPEDLRGRVGATVLTVPGASGSGGH